MADAGRMIFLGFGKYARADKIYAVEPIVGNERGGGHRTRVWIEGVPDPIIAGRTERTILHDMGQDAAMGAPILDEALKLAERIVDDADKGRVDLNDLSRRARRLLEKTSRPTRAKSFLAVGIDPGESTGQFRRLREQSPRILMSAPQAVP